MALNGGIRASAGTCPSLFILRWKIIFMLYILQGFLIKYRGSIGLMVKSFCWQFEPQHDKTNKMTCAPSEDSDQPGHRPSLIGVFAVRMKKAWVLSYQMSASEDSDQTGRMPRLIWVFAGRTVILLVLSWGGSSLLQCSLCWFICKLFQNIEILKEKLSL